MFASMSAPTAASHTLPLRNCYWVVPGLLLAGEHPNGATRDKTKERLKKLMGAGIECFVDLTKPTELLRYDTFLPFHVEYVRKAIKDHGLPSARSQMTEILEYIANAMRAGRPVYVHCRAGIGRTGTVVGCFLAERGQQGNAAIDELNRLWQQCRRSRSWPFIPETDSQAHYVREWTPTLESGFELSSLASAVASVGPMTTDGGVRGGMAGVAEANEHARRGQADGGGGLSGGGMSAGLAASARELAGRAGQGAAGSSARAGQGTGTAGSASRVGSGADNARGSSRGAKSGAAGAGRTAGAGLRAAAEQARAAVERGEVQVKAPPVPSPTSATSATPSARRGQAATPATAPTPNAEPNGALNAATHGAPSVVATRTPGAAPSGASNAPPGGRSNAAPSGAPTGGPQFELQRGEISPSIRAEIADAIAGRNSSSRADEAATRSFGNRGTAAPNGGEEAPWASVADASDGRDAVADPSTAARRARGAAATDATGVRPRPAAETTDPTSRQPQPTGAAADAAPGPRPPQRGAPATDSTGRRQPQPAAPASGSTSRQPQPTAAATDTAPGPRPPQPAAPAADVDPLLDPHTLAAARGLRERFVGTLFGLAVGDAVAAATQFRRPGSFTPIGDMLGGGPFDLPRGAWSDDTAMALCLAESLLERDGFDARDQVERYSRWQQDGYLTSTGQCVGITGSTARSLALAKWRRGLVFPGSHDPDQLDPEPLSRIASIALFYFSSLDTTLVQAADSARITCQASAVLDACKRLAGALNAALSGQPKAKILTEAGPLSETAAQTNTNAETALSAAFWAFSSTDNFRDAVLRAANVGGNSDVVAAVCGQIAGAHYGATAIPQSWRSGLMQKDLIEGIADSLLAHALVSLSS